MSTIPDGIVHASWRWLPASVRALAAAALAERERWPLWLPVLLGTGIGIYFLLPVEPPGWLGAAALALLGATALALRRRGWLLALVAIGAAAAGFAAAELRTRTVAAPILSARLGPVTVEGRVAAVEVQQNGARVVLEPDGLAGLDAAETPRRVRIRLRTRDALPAPGDVIRLRAMLMPPPRPAAPGAYDFGRQLYFAGIGAVGYNLGGFRIVASAEAAGWRWRTWLESVRHRATLRILAARGGPSGGVAAALLTGQRGEIPGPLLDAMRMAGLAHLLAISGLHIGLVAGILFFSTRGLLACSETLALRYPIKKWAAVVALAGAFGYLMISGATVPTQRAFLMLSLVFAAILIDRTAISMRPVAWAAAAVLLLHPESLVGASFQLSFAAVVALVAVYEGWRAARLGRRRASPTWLRPLFYFGGIAITTVVASLATAPFAAFHFNRVPVYDLAANLVAVPIASLWVMPWGLLTLLLMPFGLEALPLAPMGAGIDAILAVATTVSGWPGAVARLPAMPATAIVLIAAGGLWMALWRRRWRWAGAAAVGLGVAAAPLADIPDILVEETGRLYALRADDGGLGLSSGRRGQFAAETWLRRAGQGEGWLWPPPGAPGELACDSLSCVATIAGQRVAFVEDPLALDDDCRRVDILISAAPLRAACPGPHTIIDRFDLWRDGAHALWLGGGGVRVETADGRRGSRPWVVKPTPRRRVSSSGSGSPDDPAP